MNTSAPVTRTAYTYASPVEIDARLAELQHEEAVLLAKLAQNREAQKPLRTEFQLRGGWTRAFLVTDGHVHTSTACSTCFPTTEFYWLTDLSGSDEAAIVAAAGERACTVCYPSAPVDVLSRPSELRTPAEREKLAARDDRAAAKAARDAKARAAAPTASGEPLRVKTASFTETFKTERAAMIWAVQQVEYRIGYQGRSTHELDVAALELVLAAVAGKRGVDVEVVRAEVETKGAAKAAKWARA